jgi:flagellar hook protein FlgE
MAINALFNGATGLAANSAALDVVGNNLANLNTTGYKTQRTLFKDLVYQTLNPGSNGTNGVGGVNASQIGFGVGVGTIDSIFNQGAVNPTGRSLDVAIQGSGFFTLRTGQGTVYSRAGAFSVDDSGFLVDPNTGARVQRTGTVGETGPGFQVPGNLDIRVPFGANILGTPTANVQYRGNLSSSLQVGESVSTSIQVFDTQSNPRTLQVTFTKSAVNTFDVAASIPGATVTVPPGSITFDNNGLLVGPATVAIDITGLPGAGNQTVTLNLGTAGQPTGLTQTGGASGAGAVTQDGFGAGALTSASFDTNGVLQGLFSNGRTLQIAQLAIATFNNESGLLRNGNNYFTTGAASGEALIGTAGTSGRGLTQGAALEGSGVDIAIEFSRLILAQRGFQVNSRTVSAANETLQELVNIVR